MSLPLLNRAAEPDGWHDVRSPGGYEWWYFDAESDDGDTQVVAIFLQGFIFHPGYLRHHGRFTRRPTKVHPPLPSDALCAYLIVYRGGKIWKQFLTQYPAEALTATPSGPTMSIGANTLTPTGTGLDLHLTGTPWKLTGRGPQLQTDETLEANLSFDRTHPHRPMNRIFLSQAMTGAEHHWVLADPRCNVSGAITCGGETIVFTGRGYHDHNYGTAPIGPGLKHWVWGRSLDEAGVTTFHYAVPKDRTLPNELHVVRADDTGVRELEPRCRIDWSKRNLTGLRYPAEIELQELLHLRNPKLVDDAPFYMRAVYENALGGRAFCEIAYPHRLRWPILGRMIEMSIDKRPLRG
ncbi:MAG: hypothetical protein AAGD32_09455 [Planctomycetota bacterium]